MIGLPGTARIFCYLPPTDMRKGFDSLAGLVRMHFEESVLSGHLFIFVNRRKDRMKVLYWDQDGFALLYKRLSQGTYRLPDEPEAARELSRAELAMILEGITPARIAKRYRHHSQQR
jgi:transposase